MHIETYEALGDAAHETFNWLRHLKVDIKVSGEIIGMIIGLTVGCLLLILFFCVFAYCCPWWLLFKIFCNKCLSIPFLNCVNWYYYCPCMTSKAYGYQKKKCQNSREMFIQDVVTTPDGCVIESSDIRPITTRITNDINNALF
jgi:hypothetical protein